MSLRGSQADRDHSETQPDQIDELPTSIVSPGFVQLDLNIVFSNNANHVPMKFPNGLWGLDSLEISAVWDSADSKLRALHLWKEIPMNDPVTAPEPSHLS